MITPLHHALRNRLSRVQLRSESGFTMITAAMAVVVGMLLSVGAYDAVNADIGAQTTNKWEKVAYTSAQTGATDYIGHMAQDQNYYTYCDKPDLLNSGNSTGLGYNAINDTDTGNTAAHPSRRWLPYSSTAAEDDAYTQQYTIDLLPANGTSSCKQGSDPTATMVDQSSGSVRVRVTGRAGNPVPGAGTSVMPNPNGGNGTVARTAANIDLWRQKKWKRRSIVVEFRQNGFLDYAYFTDHESMDAGLYTQNAATATACSKYFESTQGLVAAADGRRNKLSNSAIDCGTSELQFASNDVVNGPLHTNDSILVAGFGTAGPNIGRVGKADAVEIHDQGITKYSAGTASVQSSCPYRVSNNGNNGYSDASGRYTCPTSSQLLDTNGGPVRLGSEAPLLQLPEDNTDLKNWALPANGGLTYTGSTKIVLKLNGKMDVYQPATAGSATYANIDFPASGVVYVETATGTADCDSQPRALGSSPAPYNVYPFMGANCGYVEVTGTYDKSLTIASDTDVIVTSNASSYTTSTGATGQYGVVRKPTATSAVLGLVANKYVRIRNYTADSSGTSYNYVDWLDAAVLSLSHSFTVDRFNEGNYLGTLNVSGAIAQAFRGPVGTGSNSTGYTKNYVYDGRLKFLTPPHFLTPEQSNWTVTRMREQVPACACTFTGA